MDDEVLGCGGTIAKHVGIGDKVFVCFVAHRVYAHKFDEEKNKIEAKCALDAKKILGYKEAKFLGLSDERLDTAIQDIIVPLEKYVENVQPDIVYINHGGDVNQDHRAVFRAAMVILRSFSSPTVKRISSYEVPSSTEQSQFFVGQTFVPNYYVDIKKYLDKKIKAIKAYKTELKQFPHPRSVAAIKTLAMKRGTEVGLEAAEAFMLIREKWE